MARRLRLVELDFVETAPLRLAFALEVAAPPGAVFRAFAEDVPGWSEWFKSGWRAPDRGPDARRTDETRRRTPVVTGDARSTSRTPDRGQAGQTPVSSREVIAAVYGAMSSPCSASHSSE